MAVMVLGRPLHRRQQPRCDVRQPAARAICACLHLQADAHIARLSLDCEHSRVALWSLDCEDSRVQGAHAV